MFKNFPTMKAKVKTLEELRDNLMEIYQNIRQGLAPDAKPFQLLETAI